MHLTAIQVRQIASRPRPPANTIRAKRREIAIRWRSRRSRSDTDKMIAGIRRREIETLIRYRHGSLPDTDDRSIYLRLWAWHNLRSRRQELDLQAMCCRLGGSVPEAEILATVRYVQRRDLRRFGPDTLGKHLMLTELERSTLGITTFETYGVTRREREQLRAEKKVERERRRRRAAGVRPRAQYEDASLSKQKPWEKAKVSRRTWYRKMAQNRRPKTPWHKSEVKHLTSIGHGLTPVPTDAPPARGQQGDSRGGHGHGPLPASALSYEHLPVEIRLRCLCLSSTETFPTVMKKLRAA
jgi:hypothetical protein